METGKDLYSYKVVKKGWQVHYNFTIRRAEDRNASINSLILWIM